MIDKIKEAIEKAKRHESKLSEEALAVPSLTAIKIRHLYNNIGALAKNFMEIGSHRGGSYTSFVYGNDNIETATAIDNYSESFHDGDSQRDFIENATKFTPKNTVWRQIAFDSFLVDKKMVPELIDVYLYDGDHAEEAQCKALTYFLPFLADEFIFLVDDYSWERVKRGTQQGIKEAGLEVLFEAEHFTKEEELPNDAWHTGNYIAYLKKKK